MFKKMVVIGCLTLFLVGGVLIGNAWAATPGAIPAPDTGDTAFMLISSALVLLMTPGLAFFYGGFVRSHNILNTLMMSFVLMGIVGVSWILWGYSLSFAPGLPFIGGLQWLGLNGVGLETTGYLQGSAPAEVVSYAKTIPHQAYMIYQAMFAIICPAVISGAIAERMSFRAYCLFVLLWSTFIYTPLAHMVWAKGGFLGLYGGIGALDFAGGTVVHISSGVSALVAAIVLGPRKNYPDRLSPPHNVPFILLGAGLLWFGWFGFNAGSALSAGSLATVAFIATFLAPAAGGITWVIMEWILRGKPTAIGIASGFLAGLVGVTPAAGFVNPIGAILIGSITAVCCFFAVSWKAKLEFDDALDTFPIHGVGGTIGAVLTGIFATKEVNAAGNNGLLFGNLDLLYVQIEGIVITYVITAIGTFVILKILSLLMPLRVKTGIELQGLDITEHGEEGYSEDFAGGTSFSDAEMQRLEQG